MNKKITTALVVVFGLLLFSSLVFAYQENKRETRPEKPDDCLFSNFEETEYQDWLEKLQERNPRSLEIITEENFSRFKEMKIAKQEGNYETYTQIRAELGLGQRIQKQKNTQTQQRLHRNQQLKKNIQNN